MNRILFEPGEIQDGVATFGGDRAAHVLGVLHGEIGQILKTGELDGLIGTSEILSIGQTGAREGASDTVITVRTHHDTPSLAPWVDLVLAPPRPRVMKRLLPQLATLGVGTIVLVGAEKVEKDFWGATLLKPENYRPLLVDGLMQGGTSIVPKIELRRNFRKFVHEELDALFPTEDRVVAHPYAVDEGCDVVRPRGRGRYVEPQPVAGPEVAVSRSVRALADTPQRDRRQNRLLLAIGPEGGWTDAEVEMLEAKGFARYSLGQRILRTDTATIALLAKLNTEDL